LAKKNNLGKINATANQPSPMTKSILCALLLALASFHQLPADPSKPVNFKYTATDGTNVDLADCRGKVVLIDFWATWSAESRAQIPIILAVRKKYKDQGFEVFGVSLDQDQNTLNTYTDEYNMSWPEYFDGKGPDSEIYKSMHLKSLPTMLLIGKDGRLISADATKNLDAMVAKALQAH
jgi:thiol-disulfide isomerase/thioredoxin